MNLKRLSCWWNGCDIDHYGNYCLRCGVDLLNEKPLFNLGFVQSVRYAIENEILRFRYKFFRTCRECDKSLFMRKPYKTDFCSKKCYDEWLPF